MHDFDHFPIEACMTACLTLNRVNCDCTSHQSASQPNFNPYIMLFILVFYSVYCQTILLGVNKRGLLTMQNWLYCSFCHCEQKHKTRGNYYNRVKISHRCIAYFPLTQGFNVKFSQFLVVWIRQLGSFSVSNFEVSNYCNRFQMTNKNTSI